MDNFISLIRQYGFTQSSFSYYFDLDIRKVQNWCSRGIPDYLYSLFENYLQLVNSANSQEESEWKLENDNGVKMLVCKKCRNRSFLSMYANAVGTEGFRFCPYCGSKMKNPKQKIVSWPTSYDSDGDFIEPPKW